MDKKGEVIKKSKQKLESLINKGGIKIEAQEYHEDMDAKLKKKYTGTHSLLNSEGSNLNKKDADDLKEMQDRNHILFKNADEIQEKCDRYYMNEFDAINNRTYHSKELDEVQEESSESSSGDEKINRAFGIERSLTMTPKVKSYHYSSSIGAENPEVEQSMLTDELKMLSFLNEDEEELTVQFEAQKNKFKNRLRKNGLIDKTQGKTLKNFELDSNKFAHSQRKKETSMFSTQDSKKQFSNSFTHRHNSFSNQNNSAHLIEVVESEVNIEEMHSKPYQDIKSRVYNQVNLEPQFSQYNNERQSHVDNQAFNMYCKSMQQDPKLFYNYYISNVDMRMVTKTRNPEQINSFNESSLHSGDNDATKVKKGKRNYLRIGDSKEFIIDTVKIEEAKKTTLMVRNIPNKYTKELMLETIDAEFEGTYDFFYLPIDFKNNCNVGYAFINFKKLEYIKPFFERFNNKKWAKFNSEKICDIKYARIQGKEECEAHFKDSSLMKQPVS